MKKIIRTLLTALFAISLASCNETNVSNNYVQEVRISTPFATLDIGETLSLNAEAYGKDGSKLEGLPFIYNSSNKTVCTVAEDGTVLALSSGSSTVTVICDTNQLRSAICYVSVNGGEAIIESIAFTKKNISLHVGESQTLNVVTTPSTTSAISYLWNSDNESVAKVVDGTVIAYAVGTARITASYGNLSDSCTVTVLEGGGGGGELVITLNKTELTIQEGNTFQLEAVCTQSVTLTYSSSNDGVATVDQTGLITANKKGGADITVSAGEVSAVCKVTVTDSSLPEETDLIISFYIDYNNIDEPYATLNWYTGKPITNANKPANPSQSMDPAFGKFVGWSSHTIIDDLKDLWNFETDVVPVGSYTFELYGIWIDA